MTAYHTALNAELAKIGEPPADEKQAEHWATRAKVSAASASIQEFRARMALGRQLRADGERRRLRGVAP